MRKRRDNVKQFLQALEIHFLLWSKIKHLMFYIQYSFSHSSSQFQNWSFKVIVKFKLSLIHKWTIWTLDFIHFWATVDKLTLKYPMWFYVGQPDWGHMWFTHSSSIPELHPAFQFVQVTITNYHKLGALKTFISHISKGWEIQDQGGGLASGSQTAPSLWVLMWWKGLGNSLKLPS